MNREEQICETCKENDNGFCDRIGRMVEDDDWCAKMENQRSSRMESKDDEHISGRTLRGGKDSGFEPV